MGGIRECIGWLAVVTFFLAPLSAGAEALFPAEKFPLHVEAVVTGDFDGDGVRDVAAVLPRGREVVILVGRGDGGFRVGGRQDVGGTPTSLAAADFDLDGRLDLAVFDAASSRVAVMLGRGDGSFRLLPERYEGGAVLLAADFDGDHVPDLAAGNQIFLGEGDGRFGSPLPNLWGQLGSQVAGDVDGDGAMDIVRMELCGGRPCRIHILLGDGTGRFSGGVELRLPTEFTTHQMVLADLDGDGTLDIPVTDERTRRVTVHFGTGDGDFDRTRELLVPQGARGIAAADFDGDGTVDLAVTDGRGVSVLRGGGGGSFGFQAYFPALPGVSGVVTGEFGGGEGVDLMFFPARASMDARDGGTLLGDGRGGFASRRRFAAEDKPTQVAAADIDGDGLVDLVVGDYKTVTLLIHEEGGGLREAGRFPAGEFQRSLVVADFDRDHLLDVATAGVEAGTGFGDGASILFGNGGPGFDPPRELAAGRGTYALAAGDLNRDGAADLAVGNLFSEDISVLLGDEGGFTPEVRYAVPGALVLLIADFDGDDLLDLLVGGRGAVSFFHGDGEGALAGPSRSAVSPGGVFDMASGDLDGDGTPDLVVRDSRREVSVHRGLGGGTFAEGGWRVGAGASGEVALSDLDGDGTLDLVIVEGMENEVRVLLGDGAGGFGGERLYATDYGPHSPVLHDFDGDGAIEILMTGRDDDVVSVYPNLLSCARADDVPPQVVIRDPERGYVVSLPAVPVQLYFETSDDDGFRGGVVHERVLLDECVLLDGTSWGDGDGLLSDEELSIGLPLLCEVSARCGVDLFADPVLAVEAEDCAGNIGSDARALSGTTGRLRPGLCGGARQP